MPEAHVNGCNLYYEVDGSGPDVVFIHGEDHGIEQFRDQIPHFSNNYRCLTYYRRGHGKSESAPYGYSLWNQTLDLAELLDSLGITSTAIVGVGMGNAVAVSYTLHKPNRVRGLVLAAWYELDGYPLLERRRQAHRMSFADLHLKMFEIRRDLGEKGLLEFIEREMETLFPIFPKDPALRSRMARMVASHPERHYVQALEHLTSVPNLVPDMDRIHCPMLGVCGIDDPSPDKPELLAHLPNFSQAWIEGARRFTVMEQPEEFNRIASSFLATLPASAPPLS